MTTTLLIGFFGQGNAGDDALLYGYLEAFGDPDTTFVATIGDEKLSLPPLCGVRKIKPTIRNIAWEILKADFVVVPGGTHLRSWGKGWLKQSIRLLGLALMAQKKLSLPYTGLDDNGPAERFIWPVIEALSHYNSVRDAEVRDLAYNIRFQQQPREKIIGVALTPVNTIYYGSPSKDWRLMLDITEAIWQWYSKLPDYKEWQVRFYSFCTSNKYSDNYINRMGRIWLPETSFYEYEGNVVKMIEDISRCSLFVGMRYHSCVFAHMANVPVIPIEVYPAVEKFAWYNGIESIEMGQVKEKLEELLERSMSKVR